MTTHPRERCSYHVGPWRRAVPWLIFGPFLLLAAGISMLAGTADDRTLGLLLLAILGPVALGLHVLISYARLELNTEGVRLRQIGMNLAAPWSDIVGLRLERGREGFVTRQPISGSGSANLAAVRGFGIYSAPLYNDEQRSVMAERRWIPIEAFVWHWRRGQLREDLVRLAPAVQPIPSLLSATMGAPAQPASRRRGIIIFCALGVLVGGMVALGLGAPSLVDRVFSLLLAVVAPVLTIGSGWRARNAFRSGARFIGVWFVLLTVIGVAWCLIAWDDAIIAFHPIK